MTFNGGFLLFFRIRFEVLIFIYFLVEAIYSVYSCYFFIVKSVTFLVFFHNFGNIYRRMAFTFCTIVFFNKSFSFERERDREREKHPNCTNLRIDYQEYSKVDSGGEVTGDVTHRLLNIHPGLFGVCGEEKPPS